MRKLFCLLLLFPVLYPAFAQESDAITNLTYFPDGHQTLVFGDKINVRARPATDAPALDQLLIGEAVTVLATDTTQTTVNGWTAQWSRIAYTKNGQRKEGFVWNGLLSPVSIKKNGATLVYNVARAIVKKEKDPTGFVYETREAVLEIRAVREGKIVSTVSAPMQIESGYETYVTVNDTLNLPPYQTAFDFNVYYPACGYAAYNVWCLWDGKQLTALPLLTSVSDAGVFHESENYIFPSADNGAEGRILYEYQHGEGFEGDGEYDYVRRVRTMSWNGKSFQKPKIKAD